MEETATSRPFMIKLPSGTKLYGITITFYRKDGNTVKPASRDEGSPLYYYTEVNRSEWRGDSNGGIQYAAPGTGAPKFYNLQGVYNYEGNKKWDTDGIVGVGAELKQAFAKSNAGKPTQISTVIATGPKAVALAANVPESGLAAKLFNSNTETLPPPTPTPASGDKPEEPITKNLPEQIKGKKVREWNKETDYYYPTSIRTNGQDFIKFNIIQYQTSKIDKKNSTSFKKKYTTVHSLANIILPIQPSITDRNLVEWGNNSLSPVDLALYNISSTAISGDADQIGKILENLGDTVTKDENVKKAITLYLKQKALNVEGLLSRFGGAIVNPNLELIFQGPQLRPFDFTFRLSPRDDPEATQVRSIIRAFKEAMAPQVSTGDLFLAAPNVFNISYHTKGKNNKEEPHPSLNKIKTCALQSCNVDYTPDGSYMTFNDEKRTMTSYNLTLQFVELEPVTSTDYKDISTDEIGY